MPRTVTAASAALPRDAPWIAMGRHRTVAMASGIASSAGSSPKQTAIHDNANTIESTSRALKIERENILVDPIMHRAFEAARGRLHCGITIAKRCTSM